MIKYIIKKLSLNKSPAANSVSIAWVQWLFFFEWFSIC
jgi:hypothetical protein